MKTFAALLLLTAGCAGTVKAGEGGKASWLSSNLAAGLEEEPKTDVDGEIKSLILDYTKRIDALDPEDPLVRQNLPRLRDNLLVLYREYNKDKGRYRGDHFTPRQCLAYLKGDMKFFLEDSLEKGKDPYSWIQGRWSGKAFWLEKTGIMGRYDLVIPKEYDPSRPWPVIFAYQDSPSMEEIRKVPYFMIRNIQRGYPKGFVALEDKTRSILKDAAGDFNIDPFRIYGTGFSFGGHTDLTQAWRHPHWFAAIAPICNDLRGGKAHLVKHIVTPTLLLHGDHDSFLATGRKIYDWMKEAGREVKWETYKGGHKPSVPFYEDVTVLTDFFEKHALDPYPKTVHHVIEHKRYSRAFWVDAILTEDKGGIAAVFTVTVRDDNVIEVQAGEEIAGFDFFLNEKLIDMNRPLKVLCDGKIVFEGAPAPKVTVSLREGKDYWRGDSTPLWEHIVEMRKTAKP